MSKNDTLKCSQIHNSLTVVDDSSLICYFLYVHYLKQLVTQSTVPFSKIYGARIDSLNPLDSGGNYSATSNNTKLVHWPLMGGLLHLVQLYQM